MYDLATLPTAEGHHGCTAFIRPSARAKISAGTAKPCGGRAAVFLGESHPFPDRPLHPFRDFQVPLSVSPSSCCYLEKEGICPPVSNRNRIEAKRAAMLTRVRRRIAEVERSYWDALTELMCLQAARRDAPEALLQPQESNEKSR